MIFTGVSGARPTSPLFIRRSEGAPAPGHNDVVLLAHEPNVLIVLFLLIDPSTLEVVFAAENELKRRVRKKHLISQVRPQPFSTS